MTCKHEKGILVKSLLDEPLCCDFELIQREYGIVNKSDLLRLLIKKEAKRIRNNNEKERQLQIVDI